MEDIRQEIDAVLYETTVAVHLLLENALTGKKVAVRDANIGHGGSLLINGNTQTPVEDRLVGVVQAVIGVQTGNFNDGFLVDLLLEVDTGGNAKAIVEVYCFHRNIITL